MSDTPMTDALADKWNDLMLAEEFERNPTAKVNVWDFARDLERQLAAEWEAKDAGDRELQQVYAELRAEREARVKLESALAFYGNRANWGPVASYSDNYWYIEHVAPWRLGAEAIESARAFLSEPTARQEEKG